MSTAGPNLSASVRQRLLNQSKAQGIDPNALLTRFGVERFLCRIARSPYADRFVLKGALLLEVWLDEPARPTRDLDLLGFGDLSAETLRRMFAAICDQPVEPDGVRFFADSVSVRAIREQDEYGGQRVTLRGELGTARLHVHVDVGIGDALTPPAEWIDYPALLDFPRPHLRAYRPETTIAEKLHAMVTLDVDNNRMKDFFDLCRLAESRRFDGDARRRRARHILPSRHGHSYRPAHCADGGVGTASGKGGTMVGVPGARRVAERTRNAGAGHRGNRRLLGSSARRTSRAAAVRNGLGAGRPLGRRQRAEGSHVSSPDGPARRSGEVDRSALLAVFDAAFDEMGVDWSEPTISAEALQTLMLEEGVRLEDNILSSGIVAAREE